MRITQLETIALQDPGKAQETIVRVHTDEGLTGLGQAESPSLVIDAILHCDAGLGRTGTVLAAYLVSRGESASAALEKVRAMRPGSVETPDQEQVITKYAELVGGAVE